MNKSDFETTMLANATATDSLRARNEREMSVRQYYYSPLVGVVIPLMQSFITAVLVAIVVGTVLVLLDYSPWKWAFVAWAIVWALSWIFGVTRWDRLVKRIETALSIDLNLDGLIGSAPADKPGIRLVVSMDNNRRTQLVDLPVDEEKLVLLAQGLLRKTPFTERIWSGTGRPFTQSEFDEIRSEFLSRGWGRWVNDDHPQQGVVLTPLGEAVMQELAGVSSTGGE